LESKDIGSKGKLKDKYLKSMKAVGVEKIVVVGAPKTWAEKTEVKVGKETARLEYHGEEGNSAAWAIVKAPKIAISENWKIEF
jgi:alpha 1,3-glucosidase